MCCGKAVTGVVCAIVPSTTGALKWSVSLTLGPEVNVAGVVYCADACEANKRVAAISRLKIERRVSMCFSRVRVSLCLGIIERVFDACWNQYW